MPFSFLQLPKKLIENIFFPEYAVRCIYNDLLLRSPTKSEISFWKEIIYSHGFFFAMNEIQKSNEFLALSAHVESNKILFMHIPKAAGSSFRTYFSKFTNKIYIPHAPQNIVSADKACLVAGHFGYSFIKSASFAYSFTILRDPIERIISLYRFGYSNLSNWHEQDPVRHLNFSQWISSDNPDVKGQIDSFYVRIMTDDLAEPFENRVGHSFALALKRFSEFSLIGDQSDLMPFLEKISALIGMPSVIKLPFDNSSTSHSRSDINYPARPKLTPEIITRLKRLTLLDYEIYNRFKNK
jgi:hypothetical protein